MSAPFDPYYKWLGIPPAEQPPNAYRLLGLRDFEDDPDVIDSAADQRMRHLRSFQNSKQAALSQKLLNEVTRARSRLLDPEEKAEYDAQLRERLGAARLASSDQNTIAPPSASKPATPTRSASEGPPTKTAWPEGQAPATLDEFHLCLESSRLLTADESRKFVASLPAGKRPDSPKALATELLKAAKLTRFQTQGILQGKLKYLSFGEYVILEKLGQGGMGQVLKAEHRRMKRTVALKVISGAAMKNADAVRRFQREVHAAARLIHTNIVTAFDANEHEGIHFFVMEYVAGKDLSQLVKDAGPLPVQQAVDYVLQAARGLAYAHSKGIVHRDIKPGNLLVDGDGTVKILDMGLARIDLGADDGQELTNTGQVMGTVDYMAPEQAEDTHSADARADIYSLGCTLYRLIAGDVLYGGDTLMKKLLAHRSAPVPSLAGQASRLPEQSAALGRLDPIFQRMVAKRPEDRQQAMTQVVAELEAFLRGEQPSVTTASPQPEATQDLKLSEFLAGVGNRKAKSATAVVIKPAKAEAAVSEATQDFRAGETSPTILTAAPLPTAAAPAASSPAPAAAKKRGSLPRWLKKNPVALLVATALFGLGLAAAGVVMFLPTADGTIRIEINDPTVEVTISDTGYKIKGKSEEVHLKPGDHTLHVKTGELEFDTTKFTLGSGDNPTVKVELLKDKVLVVQADGQKLGEHGRPTATPVKPSAMDDRAAAHALHAYLDLKIKEPGGNKVTIKPGDTLPDQSFTLLEIVFPNDTKLPTDFIKTIFLPAIANLRELSWISDGRTRAQWNDVAISALAEMPCAKTLGGLLAQVPLNKNSLATLARLPRLQYLFGSAREPTDEFWAALGRLPHVIDLRLNEVPSSTRLGKSAGEALSRIPLAQLGVGGTLESECARALAQMKTLRHLTLIDGIIDDAALTELLRSTTIKQIVLEQGTLTDDQILRFAAMKQLESLSLRLQKASPAIMNRLAAELPTCSLFWNGGQIKSRAKIGTESVQPAGEWTDLFKGRNLTGWQPKGNGEWSVENGELVGKVEQAPGWLMSEREFQDFELELEYKLPADGNSGVFVRASEGGAVSGANFSEVQLLDDTSTKYQNLGPKQRTGAIFGALDQLRSPAAKPLDWNKLHIRLVGPKIDVQINGNQVASGDLPPGKALGKHLGLQLYSPGVRFRNIRARELNTAGSVRAESGAELTNSALQFDGQSSYVDISSLSWDGVPKFTLEAWVRSPQPSTSIIVQLRGKGICQLYEIAESSPAHRWAGLMRADPKLPAEMLTQREGSAALDRVVHLAYVVDGDTARLFRNGITIAQQVRSRAPFAAMGASGASLGAQRDENGKWEFFSRATLDEVRVSKVARYDRDFTPANRFETDSDTLALYHCDEGQGAELKDSSGNAHHGKIVGAKWSSLAEPPQTPAAAAVQGLQFNGVDAGVEVPSLRFDGSHPLTLEGWVQPDELSGGTPSRQIAGWNGVYLLARDIQGGDRYCCYAFRNEAEHVASSVAASTQPRLRHVAGVWDGHSIRCYVDGRGADPKGISQIRNTVGTGLLADHFAIGHSIGIGSGKRRSKGDFFKGTITELRVSKVARYQQDFTPARRFEPDANTLALFHFDDGQGDVLTDSSGNGHHGKIIGAKWVKAEGTSAIPPDISPFALKLDSTSKVRVPTLVVDYSPDACGSGAQPVESGG